jgi:hypothetical protein
MAKKTWIQYWLIDWAKWIEREGLAYSNETTLSRAMAGQLHPETFNSALPSGVDAPKGWMQRLIVAMGDALEDKKQAKYVYVLRRVYLMGPKKAKILLGLAERTMRWQVRRGEEILRNRLNT